MADSLLLLSNFIRKPKEVGALAPSSKFLTREIIRSIDFKNSKNIVELGPGLGTFTKVILKKSRRDARLLCLEINNKFCNHIKSTIADSRLVVINSGAQKLGYNLRKFDIEKVDTIVSGLPFFNFSEKQKNSILKEIKNCLSDRGKFILFQYTNGFGHMLKTYFSNIRRKFVALNVPPSFVYICEK